MIYTGAAPSDHALGTMKDPQIRRGLVAWIAQQRPQDFILHEMQLPGFRCYVDVAAIGDDFVGYEIKSDADGVARLANQVRRYDAVCDFSYLVTTSRLARRAQALVPPHWGVLLAESAADSSFTVVREAVRNAGRLTRALLDMLTRDEILGALRAHGYSGKTSALHKTLAVRVAYETFGENLARRLALQVLRSRRTWTCRQLGVQSDNERIAHALRQGNPFICLTTNQMW